MFCSIRNSGRERRFRWGEPGRRRGASRQKWRPQAMYGEHVNRLEIPNGETPVLKSAQPLWHEIREYI